MTPWTVAHQAPLSMRFPRRECWSGLPFPSPGVLPNPGIEPRFPVAPALQADSLLAYVEEMEKKTPNGPIFVCQFLSDFLALFESINHSCCHNNCFDSAGFSSEYFFS